MMIIPAALLIAAPLAGQRTVRRALPAARWDAAMLQTATIDVADAVRERYAATIEPLVFGRFSIALSGEFTTARDAGNPYGYPYPLDYCPLDRLCGTPGYATGSDTPRFREWGFAAHGRWYPQALARANSRQSVSAYVGEFLGYRERRSSEIIYYPCALCLAPQPDTGSYYPPPGGGSTTDTRKVSAWEPGVEAGVRVVAARHLVIDVGGSFRLVRLDDYQSPVRRGDVDSRLSVSVGIGW